MILQTFTGKSIDLTDLKDDDIDIRDIAMHLSRLPRFCGAAADDYSVAQHSVLVSELCDQRGAMLALFHDAPEAYGIGDIASPVKDHLQIRVKARNEYENLSSWGHEWVLTPIVRKFMNDAIMIIDNDDMTVVHRADRIALATEAWAFMRQPEWAADFWDAIFDTDIADPNNWPAPCKQNIAVRSRLGACWAFIRRYNKLRGYPGMCAVCDDNEARTPPGGQFANDNQGLCAECLMPWHERGLLT